MVILTVPLEKKFLPFALTDKLLIKDVPKLIDKELLEEYVFPLIVTFAEPSLIDIFKLAVNEVDIIVAPSGNAGGVKVMLPLLVPLPEILKLENEPFEVKVAIFYPPVLLSYRPSSCTVFNKYFDDLLTIT